MAKSTCNPNAEVPAGHLKFEVIRSTIKDSLGQYCVPGDMAVLKRDVAQWYLDMNFIRVALPDDFGVPDEDAAEADRLAHEAGHEPPAALGRAAARKAEVERLRAAEADAAAAKEELAALRAEKAGSGPDPAGSSDDSEQSPSGGQQADAGAADEAKREPAETDTGRSAPKRRRKRTA